MNAVTFYSITAHLLCNGVLVLLLLQQSVPGPSGGLCGGLALDLHNPVPPLLFAAPWLIGLVFRPEIRRMIPAVVAGYFLGSRL